MNCTKRLKIFTECQWDDAVLNLFTYLKLHICHNSLKFFFFQVYIMIFPPNRDFTVYPFFITIRISELVISLLFILFQHTDKYHSVYKYEWNIWYKFTDDLNAFRQIALCSFKCCQINESSSFLENDKVECAFHHNKCVYYG